MKMTAEEIVKLYNANPCHETMEKIAKANECSIHDVGAFLKSVAETPEKRKPGRPKKPSTDSTKKDESEKSEIKNESDEVKKHPHTYLIPDQIYDITKTKIEELRRMGRFHADKAEEYFMTANECEDFLNGGFCCGHKDGIHGEV